MKKRVQIILKGIFYVLIFGITQQLSAQQLISGTFESGGGTRSYMGAVPEVPQENLRLVILFCGVMENASQMALRGFNNYLGDNSMVIYPEPTNTNFGFGNSVGVDDFLMVEDLITAMTSEYSINLDDICIGGFSNGGIFTYNLICDFNSPESTRPYSFKSFAIVSGAMEAGQANGSDCPIANETPAIIFHGTQDPVIAYAGGNVPPPVSLAIEATETVVQFWAVEVNGCSESPSITTLANNVTESPVSSSVELMEYNCTSSANTRLYRINGGQHAWPSGNANFDLAQSRNLDINASELIAEFFANSTSVSISENKFDSNAVTIYPNPVSDFLSIETKYALEKLEIIDISGHQISFEHPNRKISMVDLKPGIYFLRIQTEAGIDIKRILKH